MKKNKSATEANKDTKRNTSKKVAKTKKKAATTIKKQVKKPQNQNNYDDEEWNGFTDPDDLVDDGLGPNYY